MPEIYGLLAVLIVLGFAVILSVLKKEKKESLPIPVIEPEIIEIEVKAKSKNPRSEDFNFYHKECYGGELELNDYREGWTFECMLCEKEFKIQKTNIQKTRLIIAQTAIDGKQREFEGYGEWDGKKYKIFKIIITKRDS